MPSQVCRKEMFSGGSESREKHEKETGRDKLVDRLLQIKY